MTGRLGVMAGLLSVTVRSLVAQSVPTTDQGQVASQRDANRLSASVTTAVLLGRATIQLGLRVVREYDSVQAEFHALARGVRTALGEHQAEQPVLRLTVASDADVARARGMVDALSLRTIDASFPRYRLMMLAAVDAVREAERTKMETATLVAQSQTLWDALAERGALAIPGASALRGAQALVGVGKTSLLEGAGLRSAGLRGASAVSGDSALPALAGAPGSVSADVTCRDPFAGMRRVAPEVMSSRVLASALGSQVIGAARQVQLDETHARMSALVMQEDAMERFWSSLVPTIRLLFPRAK